MKKILTLLIITLLFNSCDDGELTVDNIDFGNAKPTKCSESNILYKKNDTEVLILIIPEDQNAYDNVVGTETFDINEENSVRYRLYNGTIGVDNICAVLQPGTPQITDEWIATSGQILITTTAKYATPDSETGATKITGYNHDIQFVNIVFAKSDGTTQIYSNIVFGDYVTSTGSLTFDFNPENVDKCDTNNTVYNVAEISGEESLVINNISATLINNQLGTKSEPIGETVNNVVYQSYLSALPIIPADYFCVSTTPILPLVEQIWTAELGDTTTKKGYIEVFTEEYETGKFKHTIYLNGVTFYNVETNSTFYYGNKILYGILRTE